MMRSIVYKSAVLTAFLVIAVSAFGQYSTPWRTSADVRDGARGSAVGTVTDVNEGNSRFQLRPDEDNYSQITVEADTVSTIYRGFGGTINGSPEIFVGTTGFSNLRVGDRVEVRGTGRGNGTIAAEVVTLLGRSVAADATGVGQTRSPSSISTPTASGTRSTTAPDVLGRVEGVVRQVNADEGRVVIETARRQVITVRATSTTPVNYRGDTYRISNLEVGDRIRIEPVSGGSAGSELTARTIEVMQSVQDTTGTARQVGALAGRVVSVDRRNETIRIDTGRGQVRVDLTNAADTSGRRVRASDVQVGDRVTLSGNYSGDSYIASTVRFNDDVFAPNPTDTTVPRDTTTYGTPVDLGLVTIYATVTQSLTASPQLLLRDTQNGNRNVRLYAVEDFPVRTRSGSYTTADRLKEGDSIVVKAYRDADGNYIAQTIRQR
jgi:hypothetical protein